MYIYLSQNRKELATPSPLLPESSPPISSKDIIPCLVDHPKLQPSPSVPTHLQFPRNMVHIFSPSTSEQTDLNSVNSAAESLSDKKHEEKKRRNYESVKKYRARKKTKLNVTQKQYEDNEARIEHLEALCKQLMSELEESPKPQDHSYSSSSVEQEQCDTSMIEDRPEWFGDAF